MKNLTSEQKRVSTIYKIAECYFRAFALEDFTLDGQVVKVPSEVVISPLLWRGYTCPAMCGGCCFKFSLLWIPEESKPNNHYTHNPEPKRYSFNGKDKLFLEDDQSGNDDKYCKHLQKEDGRCGIHGKHPFACDFELIKILHKKNDRTWVGTKLFGRGWNYKAVDGIKGAKCAITPVNDESVNDVLRKLNRLKQWMDYCGIENTLAQVIEHGQSSSRNVALIIKRRQSKWSTLHPSNALTRLTSKTSSIIKNVSGIWADFTSSKPSKQKSSHTESAAGLPVKQDNQ